MTARLKNDLLLRALLREPTPRRPIWLMRQAGRYLPEYRATRARAGGFLEMCTNPEIACEITLAAGRPLSPRRRHPVLRHPDDSACDESWVGIRGRRGPQIRAPGADRGRHRQARRARPGTGSEVRDRRRGAGAPRIAWQRAAHRLRRQSVDGGDLHGGRRRQQDLRP